MTTSVFLVGYILLQIMCVESSGKSLGFHSDGKSFGYFGLTEVACKEVNADFPPANITDEYNAAKDYLVLMMRRHDCDLLTAVGWYHGGDEARREEYMEKVISIDPTDYPSALEAFGKIEGEEDGE